MERDDLSLPVVPGGDEIGLGYRNLRLRAEDTPLGARPLLERLGHWDGHTDRGSQESGARGPPRVSVPPVSAVQHTTGPSGEREYGARCLCWVRAPRAARSSLDRPWLAQILDLGQKRGLSGALPVYMGWMPVFVLWVSRGGQKGHYAPEVADVSPLVHTRTPVVGQGQGAARTQKSW